MPRPPRDGLPARISERGSEFNGAAGTGGPLSGLEVPDGLDLVGGNLRAVAAPHQDAILCAAQIGERKREPDADAGQSRGEGGGEDVGDHAMAIVVGALATALGPVWPRPAESVERRHRRPGERARPELQNPVVAVAGKWSLNAHEPDDHAEIREIF